MLRYPTFQPSRLSEQRDTVIRSEVLTAVTVSVVLFSIVMPLYYGMVIKVSEENIASVFRVKVFSRMLTSTFLSSGLHHRAVGHAVISVSKENIAAMFKVEI
jgi:hypothetical protein